MIIKIKNLKIDTFLGVYDWENNYLRSLLFNVEIKSDCQNSTISDDIKDTIDYDHITNQIRNYVENNRCYLIEKMA